MARQQLDLLSFGVLIVIIAILLITFGQTGQWWHMLSLTVALLGIWIIATAGIRARNRDKYERGAYSTFVMGLLLLAVGGAWFLFIETSNLIFSVFLLLIVVGLLAIGTALPTMRKKQQ